MQIAVVWFRRVHLQIILRLPKLVLVGKLVIFKMPGSRPELFYKKAVLKNFTKSTGKHLSQNLFFNKVAGQQRY